MLHEQIIREIYAAFNNRDIDGVLIHFHPAVEWPNGWDGGYVHGHQEVRDYRTRQWAELDPSVHPGGKPFHEDGKIVVNVNQLVKDLRGNVVADGPVKHSYEFNGPLIKRMTIGAV